MGLRPLRVWGIILPALGVHSEPRTFRRHGPAPVLFGDPNIVSCALPIDWTGFDVREVLRDRSRLRIVPRPHNRVGGREKEVNPFSSFRTSVHQLRLKPSPVLAIAVVVAISVFAPWRQGPIVAVKQALIATAPTAPIVAPLSSAPVGTVSTDPLGTVSTNPIFAALSADPFTKGIPAFAPEFMSRNVAITSAIALQQAKSFQFIISPTPGTYKPYLTAMRVVNPSLKILIYVNGTFAFPNELRSIPTTWYAHDSAGKGIQSKQFGNTLMDPTNAGWIANRQQRCASLIAASGFDGCFLDAMGPAPVKASYMSSLPYNKATHANWTLHDWLGQSAHLGAMVKASVKPKLVFVNGIQQGLEYFNSAGPTSAILAGVDGGMFELFLRAPGDKIGRYPNETRWLADVKAVADMAAHGKTALLLTKVWVSGTAAQFAAWDEFTRAAFLMGYGGNACLHFQTDRGVSVVNPAWAVDLGAPTGSFVKTSAGYYSRSFATGLALANLTTKSITVPLGGSYRLPSGQITSTVTLLPSSGIVLVHV